MKKKIITIGLLVLGLIFCMPMIFLVSSSLMGKSELLESLSAILSNSDEYVKLIFMPKYPTFRSYVKLLFDSPEFFVTYWNSIKIVVFVLLGQLIVGVPAAWGFAKYNFRFKKFLFTLYIVVMLMPFQVTMLSSYLLLDKMNLINTHLSIILPGIFSTFSIFILYRSFRVIPNEIIEAARVDGSGDFNIFIKIGLPLGKNGIISAMLLQFFEYWNLMEQPLTYLSDKGLWPLSLYLPNISLSYADISFVASAIVLATSIFIFLAGEKYLEEGISTLAEKE
ncbi:MAG: carbohydrate ABC transporter permease [Clostridiales bacterium]|nr:carbohydrate ABC transporter permease [Clostridiales bacterium]